MAFCRFHKKTVPTRRIATSANRNRALQLGRQCAFFRGGTELTTHSTFVACSEHLVARSQQPAGTGVRMQAPCLINAFK